jgi:hypothetical protein
MSNNSSPGHATPPRWLSRHPRVSVIAALASMAATLTAGIHFGAGAAVAMVWGGVLVVALLCATGLRIWSDIVRMVEKDEIRPTWLVGSRYGAHRKARTAARVRKSVAKRSAPGPRKANSG